MSDLTAKFTKAVDEFTEACTAHNLPYVVRIVTQYDPENMTAKYATKTNTMEDDIFDKLPIEYIAKIVTSFGSTGFSPDAAMRPAQQSEFLQSWKLLSQSIELDRYNLVTEPVALTQWQEITEDIENRLQAKLDTIHKLSKEFMIPYVAHCCLGMLPTKRVVLRDDKQVRAAIMDTITNYYWPPEMEDVKQNVLPWFLLDDSLPLETHAKILANMTETDPAFDNILKEKN